MLKFEGFKVGQVIKAYDHDPAHIGVEKFAQGTIVEIGTILAGNYRAYVIKCDVDSGKTETQRTGKNVIVPMETDSDGFWKTERVQLVA